LLPGMPSPYMQGKNTHAPQGDFNLKTDRWSKIGLIAVPDDSYCGPLHLFGVVKRVLTEEGLR
jgi:hypothetical protein